MTGKGNRIENWNADYARLPSTYSEAPRTAADLNVLIRHELVLDDIRHYLPDVPHPRIAEVGCGGARTSVFLAVRGFDVTCTDFAPEALRLARSNFDAAGATGSLVQDDLLHYSLPEATFDCVMSFGLLVQLHLVIPRKWSSQSLIDGLWFPLRLIRNLVLTRDLHRIIERSYRDFPHYENRYSVREYAAAFEAAGNSVLRREATGALYPVIALPGGVDRLLVRVAPHAIRRVIERLDRSEAAMLHRLAPGFYLVCRRDRPTEIAT